MIRIIVQVLINAISLWVAGAIVGAQMPDDVGRLLIISIVFGLLNAFVRPILNILTCPAYVLTLGLFTFVMNVIILWFTEKITGMIEWGGFWNMLFAGIIVSVVSLLLNMFLGNDRAK